MSEYLPLFVDFSCRKVVVFGGGAVGERKSKYFAPADIIVVSPRFTECLEAMGREGLIRLERRAVKKEDIEPLIEGAFLVVAATGDKALNDEIASIAGARGILVNNATGVTPVVVPSIIKKGDLIIAIVTGGRSPAVSKYVRLRLEASLGEDLEKMVELQERLREHLKMSVGSQKRREEILRAILEDPEVWDALKESQDKAFRTALEHVTDKKTGT